MAKQKINSTQVTSVITQVANTGTGGGNWRIIDLGGFKIFILSIFINSAGAGSSFNVSFPGSQLSETAWHVDAVVNNSGGNVTVQSVPGTASTTLGLYMLTAITNNTIIITAMGR